MADKVFEFEGVRLVIKQPSDVAFENPFFETVYQTLFNEITEGNLAPQIDFDRFHDESVGFNIFDLAESHNVRMDREQNPASRKIKAMLSFLKVFPVFFNFLENINANADVTIKASEILIGSTVTSNNFIAVKKVIDDWNRTRWTRTKSVSESQAGVSTLGTISENLLGIALETFIDNSNFFKNNTSEVQSYGDFVLMCLPNNLWLSVKSNFARERLLASGFTTDILGVGFFTDSTEFTSGAKIRNFQKVGFIAMYVPDIPVTEEQVTNNTSTYSEIEKFYTEHVAYNFPLNINGKPFIRKLSEIGNDIGSLLSEPNIKKRTTIGF